MGQASRGTVLVVEDDPFIRMDVAQHLRACGFAVIEADDGESALDAIAAGARVDVVFSDVEMPGAIDGLGLARWLREHRPGLPILLATGHEPALKLAAELCDHGPPMSKPYDAHALATRLSGLVEPLIVREALEGAPSQGRPYTAP